MWEMVEYDRWALWCLCPKDAPPSACLPPRPVRHLHPPLHLQHSTCPSKITHTHLPFTHHVRKRLSPLFHPNPQADLPRCRHDPPAFHRPPLRAAARLLRRGGLLRRAGRRWVGRAGPQWGSATPAATPVPVAPSRCMHAAPCLLPRHADLDTPLLVPPRPAEEERNSCCHFRPDETPDYFNAGFYVMSPRHAVLLLKVSRVCVGEGRLAVGGCKGCRALHDDTQGELAWLVCGMRVSGVG